MYSSYCTCFVSQILFVGEAVRVFISDGKMKIERRSGGRDQKQGIEAGKLMIYKYYHKYVHVHTRVESYA